MKVLSTEAVEQLKSGTVQYVIVDCSGGLQIHLPPRIHVNVVLPGVPPLPTVDNPAILTPILDLLRVRIGVFMAIKFMRYLTSIVYPVSGFYLT